MGRGIIDQRLCSDWGDDVLDRLLGSGNSDATVWRVTAVESRLIGAPDEVTGRGGVRRAGRA